MSTAEGWDLFGAVPLQAAPKLYENRQVNRGIHLFFYIKQN